MAQDRVVNPLQQFDAPSWNHLPCPSPRASYPHSTGNKKHEYMILTQKLFKHNYQHMKKNMELKEAKTLYWSQHPDSVFLKKVISVTFLLKHYHTKTLFFIIVVFILLCLTEFVYAYQVSTSLVKTGISFQNNLYNFKLLMFDIEKAL